MLNWGKMQCVSFCEWGAPSWGSRITQRGNVKSMGTRPSAAMA